MRTPLDAHGIQQVEQLAKELRAHFLQPVALYSSPFHRNIQTAEILLKEIDAPVDIVRVEELISGGAAYYDGEKALKKVLQIDAATVIAITHKELTSEIPLAYGKQVGSRLECRDLNYGSAWVIDAEAKTIVMF
jgi:phosphohistidine phosphatase SixA